MAKLFVSTKDESVRLFKSSFLEFFSKVHFIIPVIIFLPVVVYFLYRGITAGLLSPLEQIGIFFLGLLVWTATEYVMHRWVFHYHPSTELGKRIFFIAHGVHHDYPNDSKRLVLPPSVSIPLATAFFFLWRAILPVEILPTFFSAFILGYLIYDMIHYAIHHVQIKNKLWMKLQEHHLKHHFKDPDNGFGVSSDLWDRVIGTTFKKPSNKSNNTTIAR